MIALSALLLLIGIVLLLTTLPLLLELLVLTSAALLPKAHVRNEEEGLDLLPLTVLVPAHNEEVLIGRCIRSVLASANSSTEVLVVAHNCTDATVVQAEAAGARVLVLNDSSHSGKGCALNYGFTATLAGPSQAVLVIDADSLVKADLIPEVRRRFQTGTRALQCRYEVNNSQDSGRTKLMTLAFYGANVIRPRGRARLGLSAGILGNGFAIHRDVLTRIPYGAHSIVEDLEYHLALVQAGVHVEFVDTAAVRGEMPVTSKSARAQRARWEGGRLHMMKRWAPNLLAASIRRRVRQIEPLLDLLALPIASEVILLLIAACLPVPWLRLYALAGFAVLVFHVTAAAVEGPGLLGAMKALRTVPSYVLWKLWILPEIWRTSRANAKWVRTDREPVADSK
jgi:cellulose synthase/poly-beta-1,6-N-acetylglucosamine synthase-like glycosyltransferase